MIKVFWGSLVKALVAATLAATILFGSVLLFYVLFVLFLSVFLWFENRGDKPLAESKQSIYSRMLDKE